jgi:hypothetical protein
MSSMMRITGSKSNQLDSQSVIKCHRRREGPEIALSCRWSENIGWIWEKTLPEIANIPEYWMVGEYWMDVDAGIKQK